MHECYIGNGWKTIQRLRQTPYDTFFDITGKSGRYRRLTTTVSIMVCYFATHITWKGNYNILKNIDNHAFQQIPRLFP